MTFHHLSGQVSGHVCTAVQELDCMLVSHDKSKLELDNSNTLQKSWFILGLLLWTVWME